MSAMSPVRNVAVVPARVRRARDKAKIEQSVLLVERWILARLRHRTFFSLAELNGAIAQLLERLNNRPFKKLPGTRRQAFEQIDQPALRPLPTTPYVFATWKKVRVHIDYHVEIDDLSFEERLGLLADRELTEREDRRLQTRLRQAKLKQNASLEDIDYRSPRGLDKALISQLATGQWIRDGLNLILLGPTGVGKIWIGCALAHHACRHGYTARYLRLPRLFEELRLAHADGRFPKLMNTLAKTDLILLDDWGLTTLDTEARRNLLELLDDRHGQRSTLITSQLPLDHWHEIIGDPTLADAILD